MSKGIGRIVFSCHSYYANTTPVGGLYEAEIRIANLSARMLSCR
jgi:hypothetical protein